MPFDDLLPARFRGRNERIDEPLDPPSAIQANARRG